MHRCHVILKGIIESLCREWTMIRLFDTLTNRWIILCSTGLGYSIYCPCVTKQQLCLLSVLDVFWDVTAWCTGCFGLTPVESSCFESAAPFNWQLRLTGPRFCFLFKAFNTVPAAEMLTLVIFWPFCSMSNLLLLHKSFYYHFREAETALSHAELWWFRFFLFFFSLSLSGQWL